jgi:hypothetical protein
VDLVFHDFGESFDERLGFFDLLEQVCDDILDLFEIVGGRFEHLFDSQRVDGVFDEFLKTELALFEVEETFI